MSFSHGERKKLAPQEQIWRIATAQDGLITVAQLRQAGLIDQAITRRVQLGNLHRLHRGVYAVGHLALTPQAVQRAAVLAVSPHAPLCLWSAAFRLGIIRRPPMSEHVGVVRGRRVSARPGITVHHLRSLTDRDVVEIGGLRCTTAARTLVDLAARPACTDLRELCEQAEFLGLLDIAAVEAVIERMHSPHGSKRLRAILATAALGTTKAGSRLERRVLRAVLDAGITRPVLQKQIGRARVDFFWPQHQLVLEVDGPHHDRPLQRAKDQRRDAALAERGLVVLRIRAADFDADPEGELTRLAHAMRVSHAQREKRAPRSAK